MITKTTWQNTTAVQLENDDLRVIVLPAHGGKLASIYHKQKRFELLFQNPRSCYKQASFGAPFEEFEACGFDDAFPTVDACDVTIGSLLTSYPDHGEIWSAAFEYLIEDNCVTLIYNSERLHYCYVKIISLQGNHVVCSYRIMNTGKNPLPYLWVCHCLVNYREDMKLILPEGIKKTVFSGDRMEKWHLDSAVTEGRCGYEYPTEGMQAIFTYDAKKLPYLGYWQTTGGYRGDCNCALEPAAGYYDSIVTAQKNNACPVLMPKEKLRFELVISLESIPLQPKYSNNVNIL
ncbi:DUF5107 domain-containing protein [Oscillospiraceae bacterium PP1C4]